MMSANVIKRLYSGIVVNDNKRLLGQTATEEFAVLINLVRSTNANPFLAKNGCLKMETNFRQTANICA
jgi:hypothetical protein